MRKSNTKRIELKKQLLELMAQGKNQKESANIIGITEKTVSSWLKEVKRNIEFLKETKQSALSLLRNSIEAKQSPKDIEILRRTYKDLSNELKEFTEK